MIEMSAGRGGGANGRKLDAARAGARLRKSKIEFGHQLDRIALRQPPGAAQRERGFPGAAGLHLAGAHHEVQVRRVRPALEPAPGQLDRALQVVRVPGEATPRSISLRGVAPARAARRTIDRSSPIRLRMGMAGRRGGRQCRQFARHGSDPGSERTA